MPFGRTVHATAFLVLATACDAVAPVASGDGAVGGTDGGTSPDAGADRDGGRSDPDGGADAGLLATDGFPAIYALELVLPRAEGTRPSSDTRGAGVDPGAPLPAIPATHRIYRAYPGLEYNVRAAVIGGSYPYTFALRDAPDGMTIDAATGEIRWASPDADATPTIVVTDMEGTEVSSPWTIRVTADGFRFVDAAEGAHYPSGDGSPENPYRDFADLKDDPAATYGDIVYFRAGVYTPAGIERTNIGGAWERVEWDEGDPQTWLAYPGERPILDFGFVGGVDRAAIFRVGGTYIDGFETRNDRNIGFQLAGGDYNVLRRLDMHGHNPGGEDLDGQNPAHVMSIDSEKWYTVIQDCDFHDTPTSGGIKMYNEGRVLIEDNRFYDAAAAVDWKVGIERGTFRGNRMWNLREQGIYGNMNQRFEMYVRNGEICYNLFDMAGLTDDGWDNGAVGLNWDGLAGRIDVYRNTILGRAYVAHADSDDGPFRIARNVIVNAEAGVTLHAVEDATRVVLEDNLTGAPGGGIVDENGNLTAAYESYRRTHGHRVRF